MTRLLIYAAFALVVFSCTYGANESSSRVDSATMTTNESNTGLTTDTGAVVGESMNGGVNADTAGTNTNSSGVTGTTNNRETSNSNGTGTNNDPNASTTNTKDSVR